MTSADLARPPGRGVTPRTWSPGRPGRFAWYVVLAGYGGGWWVAYTQHFGAPLRHGQPGPALYWLRGATVALPLTALLVAAALAGCRRLATTGGPSRAMPALVVVAVACGGGLAVAATELVSLRLFFSLHGDPGAPPGWLLLRDGLQAFRADLVLAALITVLFEPDPPS